VGPVDVERVEQPTDGGGEVTERIGLVHLLAGPAVAGQVRHDNAEPLREGIDVAGVVRHPRGPRPAAVQQHHRLTGSPLGDGDIPRTDSHQPLLRGVLPDAHLTSHDPVLLM
jgi:hypothetical protein